MADQSPPAFSSRSRDAARPGALVCPQLTIIVALAALNVPAHAQELEPRAYSNSPIGMNFVLAGVGYNEGNLLFDPSVPVAGASATLDVAVVGFAHSFGIGRRSAKLGIVVPYAALDASGLLDGELQQRNVTGFADPTLALSINLSGAPALSQEEFRGYRQDTIIGATLKVSVPAGRYDADRLLNIGTNRWSFRPEIGFSHAIGAWIIEGAATAAFYEANDDFFRGRRLEQDPIYSAQGHVIYNFEAGLWVAVDATYYTGGESTIDGVRENNQLGNWRSGITLAIPINRYHSIKLAASRGISTRTGTDFDAYALAWQYRWGGGF